MREHGARRSSSPASIPALTPELAMRVIVCRPCFPLCLAAVLAGCGGGGSSGDGGGTAGSAGAPLHDATPYSASADASLAAADENAASEASAEAEYGVASCR